MQGLISSTTLKYDYLVYAVGAETQTFNIPGVKEHACFMKELDDAEKVRLAAVNGDVDAHTFPLLDATPIHGLYVCWVVALLRVTEQFC